MKIGRFIHNGECRYGQVVDGYVTPIAGNIYEEFSLSKEVLPLSTVKLLPPVQPGNFVCVGLNYKQHADEVGLPIPEVPMIFMCSNNSVIPDGGTILLNDPQARIDYEAEIAIVIGKQARNILAEDVSSYILGYTICNDVSNRDLQWKDGQFTRAKSFDTYKPLGPWIETDLDANNVSVELRLNGELRQSSNSNDMIFSIETIVSYVSGFMTLSPGDVVITGTPSGVGPLHLGDFVEIKVEGIGKLTSKVGGAWMR